ncbi:MAG TPA: TlyA family RNA methyltransferase [bacterium]|nr:TlyA family RNA methyltransferase [bacterium]
MTASSTSRLDVALVERGLAPSRERAQRLILAGLVDVDGARVDKAGAKVGAGARIEVRGTDQPFVSRGGLKLEHALKEFGVDVRDRVAMDVGASTGGFTDCLLQRGASKVYAVDVGYGQLDYKLRTDPRVVVMERENFRHLARERVADPIDVLVGDLSFISLALVLPKIREFLRPGGDAVLLVKPQFEVGKGKVGKGGIVRDEQAREGALAKIEAAADAAGMPVTARTTSPITGAKGNVEYLVRLRG